MIFQPNKKYWIFVNSQNDLEHIKNVLIKNFGETKIKNHVIVFEMVELVLKREKAWIFLKMKEDFDYLSWDHQTSKMLLSRKNVIVIDNIYNYERKQKLKNF